MGNTFILGLITMAHVAVLTVIAMLIWVPISVAIGFNLRLAQLIQPVAQFLSAFPANFLRPSTASGVIALHCVANPSSGIRIAPSTALVSSPNPPPLKR